MDVFTPSILMLVLLVIAVLSLIYLSLQYRSADHSGYDLPASPLMKPASEVSAQHQNVLLKLAEFHRTASTDISKSRQQMEDLFGREVDAEIIPVDVNGVPAEWVIASDADPDKRLLYIHGGAFRVGSPKSHRYLTAELSRLAGVSVLSIDYRMQPEFKTIHCHEDVRTAYQWILKNGPNEATDAEHLFIAGDSAGGNLTLAVIAWARDQGLPPATGAIALAPVTDSTFSSPSWKSNLDSDPFLGPAIGPIIKMPKIILSLMMRRGLGKAANSPEISPLLGDLSNLPPTLIQVSHEELLFDDGQRYANKAISQGGDVRLQVWPTMVHVFQAFGPDLPEANDALGRCRDFIRSLMD